MWSGALQRTGAVAAGVRMTEFLRWAFGPGGGADRGWVMTDILPAIVGSLVVAVVVLALVVGSIKR